MSPYCNLHKNDTLRIISMDLCKSCSCDYKHIDWCGCSPIVIQSKHLNVFDIAKVTNANFTNFNR